MNAILVPTYTEKLKNKTLYTDTSIISAFVFQSLICTRVSASKLYMYLQFLSHVTAVLLIGYRETLITCITTCGEEKIHLNSYDECTFPNLLQSSPPQLGFFIKGFVPKIFTIYFLSHYCVTGRTQA